MAIVSCPECKKDVSDKALVCPHCGIRLRRSRATFWAIGAAVVSLLVGGGVALAMHKPEYAEVEQLRAEQDSDGTKDEHVRQRFYRLYEEHPHSAMYIYLWARCVDDPAQQLELAHQGIEADPRFAWNYNMAARALARLDRVPEAYDQAVKGAQLDPGNLELSKKKQALKTILDRKLMDQPKPEPGPSVTYVGLFHALVKTPERADLEVLEKTRAAGYKGRVEEAVRGFVVCDNPYSDRCIRAYVPRDDRFKPAWARPDVDVGTLAEHRVVHVVGTVVVNGKGEDVMLADTVAVDP